jgi:nucleoside-diphosphate-sugar epimerase
MKRILVTGALGQIGTELTTRLRDLYGTDNVLATDVTPLLEQDQSRWAPYEPLDVRDRSAICRIIQQRQIDTIFHMAAILSAVGEQDPQRAWNVNINGLHNVLESARSHGVQRIFCPSSIAVFGPNAPRTRTPQDTITHPKTMYGVTKVTGELLGSYYVDHYGLDIRGIRYPGVISSEAPPGGGTTDYAVEIFYAAVRDRRYTCFVSAETALPMIYMPDCIRAAIDLMCADASRLIHRTDFNISPMSFSAGQLADEIRRHLPDFECTFEPDHRQAIADSWPRDLDDSAARNEWDWKPEFGLSEMTADMLDKLAARINREGCRGESANQDSPSTR